MVKTGKAVKGISPRQRGKKLRKFREEIGVTLEEVATLSSLTKSMISKFELGHRVLSREAEIRLVSAIVQLRARKREADRREAETRQSEAIRMDRLAGELLPKKYELLLHAQTEREIDEILSGMSEAEKEAVIPLLETRNAALEKELAAKQPDPNEALANLIEGTSAGPLGQFLGDILAPDRPGASERYKALCDQAVQERARLASRLENATSIDDPIVQEIIESFRREIAELKGEQPGIASCLRLFQSAATGRQITEGEFAEAMAASDRVKKLKAAVKAEDEGKASSDE